jgi:hypothetical protein
LSVASDARLALGEAHARRDVVDGNRLLRLFEHHVGKKLRQREHATAVQHHVVDVAVQDEHRGFAAQVASAQIFGPCGHLSRFAHT